MSQMKQPVHVWVWEVAIEFPLRGLLACIDHTDNVRPHPKQTGMLKGPRSRQIPTVTSFGLCNKCGHLLLVHWLQMYVPAPTRPGSGTARLADRPSSWWKDSCRPSSRCHEQPAKSQNQAPTTYLNCLSNSSHQGRIIMYSMPRMMLLWLRECRPSRVSPHSAQQASSPLFRYRKGASAGPLAPLQTARVQ